MEPAIAASFSKCSQRVQLHVYELWELASTGRLGAGRFSLSEGPAGLRWCFLLKEKLGLVLMGGSMLSKSLIQFSVNGQDCVPSLLFDLRPNYGGGIKIYLNHVFV